MFILVVQEYTSVNDKHAINAQNLSYLIFDFIRKMH